MERPSDRHAAVSAAPGAGGPRWQALLATGIRQLAVWGTGLLAALVALLALARSFAWPFACWRWWSWPCVS